MSLLLGDRVSFSGFRSLLNYSQCMHIPPAINNHMGDSDSILLCKGSLRDELIKEFPFWTQLYHHVNLISGPKDLQELDDGTVANPP